MSPFTEEHVAEWASFDTANNVVLKGIPTTPEEQAAAKERKAKRAAMKKRLVDELNDTVTWSAKKIEKELDRLVVENMPTLAAKAVRCVGNNSMKVQPSKKKPERMPLVVDQDQPYKTIYLIRHGQSKGQVAQKNGMQRNDMALHDCDLSSRGISEARHLPKLFSPEELESIQVVISSPMTRALHTALLGFQNHDIIVHYDLREMGSKIPENIPREMKDVLDDLEPILNERNDDKSVKLDVETMQPDGWPWRYSPNVKQRDLVREAFRWMYRERNEDVIAVVCHYNVIRSSLSNGNSIRPENATPIRCKLFESGVLIEETGS